MKRALVIVALLALVCAGFATAGGLTKIMLKPGHCVTVSKVHICAAAAKKPVVITRTTTLPGVPPPAVTVTAPAVTVTVTTQAAPPPPPPGPATTFGDGTFRVNVDIQPGTYQGPGGDTCYWARLSGFGGTLDEIIANNFGPTGVVTISPSDAGFQSDRCGTWHKV